MPIATSIRLRRRVARALALAGLGLASACGSEEAAREAQERAMPPADLGAILLKRHSCLRCHDPELDPPPAPGLSRIWASTAELEDGRSIVRDEAYMRESIVNPGRAVVKGFKPTMPSYGTRLQPYELEAILTHLRSQGT